MGSDIPKQFLELGGVPVLARTMKNFQDHPEVTAISAVIVEGWEDEMRRLADLYGISKLVSVVLGGDTGHESIRNGIFELESRFSADAVVLVHDAIRPLTSADVITRCIETTRVHGNGITAIHAAEVMLVTDDWASACEVFPRNRLARAQTPQGFGLGRLAELHREAMRRDLPPPVASCELAIALGETVHLSLGSQLNLKLTTPDDMVMAEALLATGLLEARA